MGPYVQMSETVFPVQPLVPLRSASNHLPVEREETATSSFAVYVVAGALLCGAVNAIRRETAVAEPDLEAATSAASLAKVAILFTFGSKSKPKPKTGARSVSFGGRSTPKTNARKPAPKRVQGSPEASGQASDQGSPETSGQASA